MFGELSAANGENMDENVQKSSEYFDGNDEFKVEKVWHTDKNSARKSYIFLMAYTLRESYAMTPRRR